VSDESGALGSAVPPSVAAEDANVGSVSTAPDPPPAPADPAAVASAAPKTGEPERPRPARNTGFFRAFRTGRPVAGKVSDVNKGGFEVKVGRARGFCPRSQIDLPPGRDPQEYVGHTLHFRITQIRRGGEDLVLSRRALLEEQRLEEAKAVRATLLEGAVMQGHVAGVADFGAFVDLGAGVMGLVHVSELSHARVARVADVVKAGDSVAVRVLKLDEERGRISLSMRQAQEDPWDGLAERFQVGRAYPGSVRRLTDFGAFVELAPGVEALAPASEFPPLAGSWRERVQPGERHDWIVLSVDAEQRRISLTPAVEGFAPGELPPLQPGATYGGKVQRVERFGVFVWLAPGRVGLIPAAWTGVPRGGDLERRFAVGSDVEVRLVEAAPEARRLRLALAGARIESEPRRPEAVERPARRPAPRPPAPPARAVPPMPAQAAGAFGNTLADKLKAALDRSSS
jgi:small subunit ribosomal protein S1